MEGILKDFVSLLMEVLLAETVVVHQCAVGFLWIVDVEDEMKVHQTWNG